MWIKKRTTMEKQGWIAISRSLREHWLWQDAERLKWWIDLRMMAAYEERITYIRGHKITLHSGQIIAGVDYLAERWGRNKRTVMRFLQMLEREGMIVRTVMHNSVAIITVMDEAEEDAECAGVLGSAVHQRIESETYSESASFGGAQKENCTPEYTTECTSDRTPEYTGNNDRKSGSYGVDKKECLSDEMTKSAPQYNNIRRKNNIDDNARERGFVDEEFLGNVQKLYRVSGDVLADKLKAFTLHVACRGVQHKSCEDARRHFCDWLRIQLNCECKEKRVMVASASTTNRRRRQEPSHDNGCDYSTSF